MKKSDALLRISAKLQKQIHLMKSMTHNPKMLCDNLASRVMTELEDMGMRPPATYCYELDPEWFGGEVAYEDWEQEEDRVLSQEEICGQIIAETLDEKQQRPEVIIVSAADYDKIQAELDNPSDPNEALRHAFKTYEAKFGPETAFPIEVNSSVPDGEAHFTVNGQTVGKIVNIDASNWPNPTQEQIQRDYDIRVATGKEIGPPLSEEEEYLYQTLKDIEEDDDEDE